MSDQNRALRAIAWAGFACGCLDLTAACVTWGLRGVTPFRVLQGIASGLLGAGSFASGWPAAALGAACHFFIAFAATTVFYGASRRLGFLTRRPLLAGIGYGVAVYLVMYWVVVPLSRAHRGPFSWSATAVAILTHMVCVGTPIAFVVARIAPAARVAPALAGAAAAAPWKALVLVVLVPLLAVLETVTPAATAGAVVGAAPPGAAVLASTSSGAPAPAAVSPATVRWFQATEQSLMDSIAVGDKRPWLSVLDPSFVGTTEEGEVVDRKHFLADLRPLPPGLRGGIAVRELTVQMLGEIAVVRYLADEWEQVFGQRLTTRYRTTDTFRRAGGAWKLASSHVSVVTQDPPAQQVATSSWPSFVGTYRLPLDGWTFTVELRGGKLFGGRDPAKLRPFVPLAPNAFVLAGSLGDWIFAAGARGAIDRLVEVRKFEVLVWMRMPAKPAPQR